MSASADSLPTRLRAWTRRIRRGYLLALLVLVGSLLLVAMYARSASEREQRLAEAGFVAHAEELAEFVRQRLLQYELSLRGGVALHGAAVESQVERQWRGYVEGLDVGNRLPGLMGLGFIAYLSPDELVALQLRLREDSGELFTVSPRGARPHYGVVVYFEPETPTSRGVVGFDGYSEPLRRAAMDAARDTGEVRLSAPVGLRAPDANRDGPSVLMYAPVYRGGPASSPDARREAISGWVYAPFRSGSFLDRPTIPVRPDVAFRIVDIGADGSEYPVLTSGNYLEGEAGRQAEMVHSIGQTVYGRSWRYEFQRLSSASEGMRESQVTLLTGVLASVLLFAVVLALAQTQSRAETLAHRLSASYRRSEQRFRNAMQYSASGMVLLDRHGAIVETNPAMAEIAGVSQAALTGTRFSHYLVDGHDEASRTREQLALREGVHRTIRRLRRRDGDIREVHLASTLLPGEQGSDVVRLVQVEDVTERVRAEAQVHALNRTLESRVEQRTRELTHANHELESFAYIVSHDLRAPLRSIEGFGRILSERYQEVIDAQGRDYLARVRNAANRMDALIDALLAMSRITRGEFTRTPLDISALAREVVDELRDGSPAREVDVVIAPGLAAEGDAALVRNLLQNLIGNAWKFTSATADARIELGREVDADGSPVFFVRDNGAGFNADYAGKLFRPFQRLHREDEYAGHGVGLASVKRIVERHGGRISAEGHPGAGAIFRFTLGGDATTG